MSIRFLFLLLFILPSCSRTVYVPSGRYANHFDQPTISQKHHVNSQKYLVMLDPGHGGKDQGTNSSKKPRYQEKYLTMTTARMVKEYLEKMGYKVLMTRNKDVYIHKNDRAEMANQMQPDLFVSIHYNAAPSKNAEGIEVFYSHSPDDADRSKESKKLANNILDRVLEQTDAKSRGVKQGDYVVINRTTMPAVLIEGGFLTNANEVEKLKSGWYHKKIAWGIAQGIHEYLNAT